MADDELRGASLEVLNGKTQGAKLPLAGATATFGRAPGNTHVIHDTAVSRQHAKIFVRDGRHWIADLNSSHGTFVNGTKVTLQTLVDGDEIKIGATLLSYAATARSATPPPAPPKPEAAAQGAAPKPAPKLHPPEASTGSFELELPEAGAPPGAPPPSPATSGPLPPLATGYRRAFTLEGEDPFADEKAKPASGAAPSAAASSDAPPARGSAPPAIEMRGETARQFASRGAAQPVPASSPKSATTHLPPPIAARRRARTPFSFLRDELDQRGTGARLAALVLALAAAGALFWLALRLFESAGPAAPEQEPGEESAPTGPSRPILPPR